MASSRHQFMLMMVASKMRSMGFEPVAYDGDWSQINLSRLNKPFKIKNHRPDIIGVNQDGRFCIGEVKTEKDLSSKRTKNQLLDFSENVEFIVCFPKNSIETVSNKLDHLNIIFKKNVHLLQVPEELMPNDCFA